MYTVYCAYKKSTKHTHTDRHADTKFNTRIVQVELTTKKIFIKESLVANFRYTNFWVAWQE